jgi:hypothetical protein
VQQRVVMAVQKTQALMCLSIASTTRCPAATAWEGGAMRDAQEQELFYYESASPFVLNQSMVE